MAITIKRAKRSMAWLKFGIAGPSGSGKTLSSLQLGFGLVKAAHPGMADADLWEKICLIDTENGSGNLYVGSSIDNTRVGEYQTIDLTPPFTAERYLQAITIAEEAGIEYLIIDSLSHAWSGAGGLLELQSNIANRSGNSYTAWREVTPLHNRLVERILQCKMHVALTLRTKVEYAIEENERGKKTPRKIGMAPIFRDGFEYECSVFFDVGQDHTSNTSKDRTGIFDGLYFRISPETGAKLYAWLSGGDMTAPTTPRLISPAPSQDDLAENPALPIPLSARVDAAMKSHCDGMDAEQKKAVAARLKQIAGTANFKAVTDESTLQRILDEFEHRDDEEGQEQ